MSSPHGYNNKKRFTLELQSPVEKSFTLLTQPVRLTSSDFLSTKLCTSILLCHTATRHCHLAMNTSHKLLVAIESYFSLILI